MIEPTKYNTENKSELYQPENTSNCSTNVEDESQENQETNDESEKITKKMVIIKMILTTIVTITLAMMEKMQTLVISDSDHSTFYLLKTIFSR